MRSIWNGSISFGLVNIPVKMYSATESRTLDLDMLDGSDHARIRYQRINENTGKEVEWKDIVKGYKKGEKYVILEDSDFEMANAKKSSTLDIETFVEAEEVPDMLFKKPYYLEPQKEGGKSYNLLRDSLNKAKKLGVATFVMRQRENLALIGVYENVLVVHVIRFAEQIRDPSEVRLPSGKVSKKELDMAKSLIDQYTAKFDIEAYRDTYNEQLMKVIESKAKGKKAVVKKLKTQPTADSDLLAQLKASLKKRKKAS
jgi:DNA end-binding protein Ku